MKILSSRRLVLGALLIAAGAAGNYFYGSFSGIGTADKGKAKGGKPPTPVLVAEVTTKTIPMTIRTIGTLQARSTVSVRSRVEGQIMETTFSEGQTVNQGDILFRIDPRPFQAKLREAEANLAREQSSYEKARADVQRYQSLSDKGFSSQQKYEEAKAAMNGLTASMRATQATIDLARLDIEFATIKAPISGRTGSVLIQAGNLVKANDIAQPLVVINEIDPMLAAFSVPEAHLPEIKHRMTEGTLNVEAALPESRRPPIRGKVVFINNAVDTQTGTILMKAEFDNKDGFLTAGQFVRVTLEMNAIQNARVVPERALQAGQKGTYLFVVGKDNTVAPVSIVPGPTFEGFTVVGNTLDVGTTVVTDGQLRLFKGAKVTFKGGAKAKDKAKDKNGKAKDGDKPKEPGKDKVSDAGAGKKG